MTRLTLHGTPMYTEGALPAPGQEAPRFSLTSGNLTDVGLDHFGRQCKLLNIVPSLELPVCEASTRRLDEQLCAYPDAVLITVSQDLPFSSRRFGFQDARRPLVLLSTFRSPQFARAYGVDIVSGPLKGLMAPAVFVLDARHRVVHAELVREMSRAPDHAAALAAVGRATGHTRATTVASTTVASVAP